MRAVALPVAAVEAFRAHLAEFVPADTAALVFTGGKGAPLRSGNFNRAVRWTKTVQEVGCRPAFTSMTFATRVTRWQPRPGRVPGS